ncbi:putative protein phosphatase 2C 1 isoform X3 [Cucumis melo var. makuwa]|uniref:Protein phosphatase n=1 Tax=Cucumis melo var. makuwa TaxID=1194695 RepID=A0A5D3DU16_CUCMM|nr:putative protein phosphatase 2C 1 isoform X3 [Cucumis melo var. makuwa]TYK27181.1 putative protein phosphatase 2C 1 isoform X3 [Cucumis melo var. makuwa]
MDDCACIKRSTTTATTFPLCTHPPKTIQLPQTIDDCASLKRSTTKPTTTATAFPLRRLSVPTLKRRFYCLKRSMTKPTLKRDCYCLPSPSNGQIYDVLVKKVNNDPQILLRKAHAAMSATGSATVFPFTGIVRIIAMMERDGILKIANVGDYGMLIIAHVGDCGLKIIRKSQIIFSTSPQEHFFDCPYQLSSERVGQTFLDATKSGLVVLLMKQESQWLLQLFYSRGGDEEWRNNCSKREACTVKKSRTDFVSTWNVAGKSPPNCLNLEDRLHASPPVDIYVLGYLLILYMQSLSGYV